MENRIAYETEIAKLAATRDGRLELAQARIQYLVQTIIQVHNELHVGPAGDGLYRLRAMRLIETALDGAHD